MSHPRNVISDLLQKNSEVFKSVQEGYKLLSQIEFKKTNFLKTFDLSINNINEINKYELLLQNQKAFIQQGVKILEQTHSQIENIIVQSSHPRAPAPSQSASSENVNPIEMIDLKKENTLPPNNLKLPQGKKRSSKMVFADDGKPVPKKDWGNISISNKNNKSLRGRKVMLYTSWCRDQCLGDLKKVTHSTLVFEETLKPVTPEERKRKVKDGKITTIDGKRVRFYYSIIRSRRKKEEEAALALLSSISGDIPLPSVANNPNTTFGKSSQDRVREGGVTLPNNKRKRTV